jgi:hypothetical protein
MRYSSSRASIQAAGGVVFGRHTRGRYSLPLFAFTAALTLVLVLIFAPNQVQAAVAVTAPVGHLQSLNVNGSYTADAARDGYGVTKKVIAAAAPAAASVPAGEAQLIAYNMLISMGMGDDQFSCLVSLWNKESHWSTTAGNPVSGAYGIPQALPGSKMASAGPDWQTDATTQITWGLGYIDGRYGSPCAAWAHSEASNWY